MSDMWQMAKAFYADWRRCGKDAKMHEVGGPSISRFDTPEFVARFVAQIPGDCWYSLVPIGTRRSSAVPTSPNESQ